MTLEAHINMTHMTESDASKQVDHILQDTHSCEIRYRQSSSQRRDEGWNERRVVCWFAPGIDLVVEEFEVLQVLEQPNEVYDLPARPLRFPQGQSGPLVRNVQNTGQSLG